MSQPVCSSGLSRTCLTDGRLTFARGPLPLLLLAAAAVHTPISLTCARAGGTRHCARSPDKLERLLTISCGKKYDDDDDDLRLSRFTTTSSVPYHRMSKNTSILPLRALDITIVRTFTKKQYGGVKKRNTSPLLLIVVLPLSFLPLAHILSLSFNFFPQSLNLTLFVPPFSPNVSVYTCLPYIPSLPKFIFVVFVLHNLFQRTNTHTHSLSLSR